MHAPALFYWYIGAMQDRYEFVVTLVRQAGEKILESKDRNLQINSKNGDYRDLVTDVDLEVGEFVRSEIAKSFPGESFFSEESGGDIVSGTYWSVDPIDGTSNFARGIPHYAVVISYVESGESIVGAIYNPVTQELFSFDKAKGAFLNGKALKVSQVSDLKESYVLLHIGRKEEVRSWGLNLFEKLLKHAKKNINFGSSALDLAFLASGRVEVVIYGTMTTIDIATATALVRASGGEVYGIDGSPIKLSKTPQQIIATSSKKLFEEIIAL